MLVLLLAARAHAWPTDSAWLPLTRGGADVEDVANDYDRDANELPAGIDCIGDSTLGAPALYYWADATDLYLRVRLNDTPWLVEGSLYLANDWSFLLDTDGDDSNFEYVIGATGLGVYLYQNTDGDSGLDATLERLVDTGDASYTQATDAGSALDGSEDWFLDARLDLANLPDGVVGGGTFRVAVVTGVSTTPLGADADLCGTDDSVAVGDLASAWADAIGIDQDDDGLSDLDEDALGTDKTDADSDDDGLLDGEEGLRFGIDPTTCDSDGDGLPDGLEVGVSAPWADTDLSTGCFIADGDSGGTVTDPNFNDSDGGLVVDGTEDRDHDGTVGDWETDPNNPGDDDADNLDGDGIPQALEDKCGGADPDDRDGDGVADSAEGFNDTDGDGIPDFCEPDDDDDGVPTADESTNDTDGDGLPDRYDADADNDGVPDGYQLDDADCDTVLDAYDMDDTDGPCADPDGDGLDNAAEADCGTNPDAADTDGDGLSDRDEDCSADADCDQLPDPLDNDTDPDGCLGGGDTAGDTGGDSGADPLTGGTFTGGSCSTGGGTTSLLGALAAAGMLARRRKKASAIAVAAVMAPATAHAADPTVNVQRFHPSFDNDTFFVVHDTTTQGTGFGAGLLVNLAGSPLEYRYPDGRSAVGVVDSLTTFDLGLGYSHPGWAVSANLPLNVVEGSTIENAFAPGDLRLGASGQILDRRTAPLGLSMFGDLSLPTGDGTSWVGSSNPELGAGVGFSWGKKVVLAGNLGMQIGAPAALGDLGWGSRFVWGSALSLPLSRGVRLIGEVEGESALSSIETIGASPIEWRVGGRGHVSRNLVASVAAGTGITDGIGAPQWRVIAGLSWVPNAEKPLPRGNDRDGDGIVDLADLCPDQAEDRNGTADEDGCPENGLVPTHFVVSDAEGRKLASASIELLSGPEVGRWAMPDGDLTRSLAPGDYQVKVRAPHFVASEVTVSIPSAPRHERVFSLDAAAAGGTVIVSVQNGAGQPLAALVTILGEGRKFTTGPDGLGSEPVPAGEVELSVWAESYRPERVRVNVGKDEKQSVSVTLEPSRVVVLADRVDIRDKVFFDVDSATIKAESFRILDDMAATLDNHPELRLVEVQGHTDDQGAEDYNQELSQRRAEAVRKYLIGQGVEPDRLVARGYGEAQPLQPGTSDEAREVNRRVVFHILAGPHEEGGPRRPRP